MELSKIGSEGHIKLNFSFYSVFHSLKKSGDLIDGGSDSVLILMIIRLTQYLKSNLFQNGIPGSFLAHDN